MLTTNDLNQIRQVVKNEINAETPKIVKSLIHSETPGIVKDLIHSETPGIIKAIVQSETPVIVENIITKSLKPIKKDLKKIRKDLEFAVGILDRNHLLLEKRVDRIEDHLHLPQT